VGANKCDQLGKGCLAAISCFKKKLCNGPHLSNTMTMSTRFKRSQRGSR
jgi:hypothetical protein